MGEWIAEKRNRDELVIATKYARLALSGNWFVPGFPFALTRQTRYTSDYRSYELGKGRTVNYAGNHRKSLHMSVKRSLQKLQTDYIDILYVHWWVSHLSSRP